MASLLSLRKTALHSLLIVTLLACGGCVTGRRQLDLEIPTAAKIVDGSKGTVSIVAVVDKRKFENKPSEPSTPSINGDSSTMSAADRGKMIGRQRNTFGKAMGDISLKDQTVANEMRLLVAEAFKRQGYSVTNTGTSKNRVEVTVDKFWAWFTPGMWAVDFEADVRADMKVSLNGRSSNFTVVGHGKNSGQMASDANWKLAYSRAFENFLNNLEEILQSLDTDLGLDEAT